MRKGGGDISLEVGEALRIVSHLRSGAIRVRLKLHAILSVSGQVRALRLKGKGRENYALRRRGNILEPPLQSNHLYDEKVGKGKGQPHLFA